MGAFRCAGCPTLVVLVPTIGASLSCCAAVCAAVALALTWGQAGELNGPRRSLYQLLVGTDLTPAGLGAGCVYRTAGAGLDGYRGA